MKTKYITRGRVVIIGLGGIGLFLSRSVVTFLAGLLQSSNEESTIELLLCDGDAFTLDNAYRMDIPDFGNKAEVVGLELLQRVNCPRLTIRWEPEYITETNGGELIQDGDCVLLACDNHKTRRLVGVHCTSRSIQDIILISGGNDGIEDGMLGTYGNVQVFIRECGKDRTAPIHEFHPEIANPADQSPSEVSCLEQTVTGAPQFSIVNMAVASAMCNALLRILMPPSAQPMYDEVALDVLEGVSVTHYYSEPDRSELD